MLSRIHISRRGVALHNANTIAAWVKPAKLMAMVKSKAGQTISAVEVADRLDTISYEVLTRLKWVIHREVV